MGKLASTREKRTLDETTDTDGGGEGSTALVRAVEPSGILVWALGTGRGQDGLLGAHEVLSLLGGVVEAATVVDGDVLTHLGVVNAVAVFQNLLFDAHCE